MNQSVLRALSESAHLGQCVFMLLSSARRRRHGIRARAVIRRPVRDASMGVCARALCYLAKMTLGNCSLSGGLSVHITVTKGWGLEEPFIPPTYPPPLSF